MVKNENYDEFIEKFKPKKTTDDCYTPPKVYQTILDWCVEEYGIDRDKVVRPFYPGGDYKNFDYSNGAVVVDNPPFSIFKKIKDFYCERKIPFFLFGPGLTMISKNDSEDICYIFTGINITYENGAKVNTGFVTNLDPYRFRIAQDLREVIDRVQKNEKINKPKYQYPPNLLTGGLVSKYANAGVDFKVKSRECATVSKLDEQKLYKKDIFGSGVLLSEKKTQELLSLYDNAVQVKKSIKSNCTLSSNIWHLSDREKDIISKLD